MNAQDIITEIEQLPLEEKKIIFDFVVSNHEEEYKNTNYPPEEMAKIDQRDEEIKKGINVEEFSSLKEARKSLGLT